MTRQLVGALAFTLALALAGQPALAKGSRGGGGRSGGSHGGSRGGHAAYSGGKSAPGHVGHRASSPRVYGSGSMAEFRHSRAGVGRSSSYYRPYYRGSYRPYYRGSYSRGYRYHRPRFYGSLFFGWPFYYSAWPYYSYYPSYYPDGYVGYDVPDHAPADPDYGGVGPDNAATNGYDRPDSSEADLGQIRLEVRPQDASVYVDDEFRGTASEARALELPPGHHVIELVRPGFRTEHRQLNVVTGANPDILVEMQQPR